MPDFRNTITQNGVAVSLAGHTHPGFARGTAFPTSPAPALGDVFFRTDLMLPCTYDGTRWVTLHEYVASGNIAVSAGTSAPFAEIYTVYAPYITKIALGYQVATPNNATNYWNINVRSINAAYSNSSTILSVSTATGGTAWVNTSTDVLLTKLPAYYSRFDINLLLGAGSPGSVKICATVYYRLIIP